MYQKLLMINRLLHFLQLRKTFDTALNPILLFPWLFVEGGCLYFNMRTRKYSRRGHFADYDLV